VAEGEAVREVVGVAEAEGEGLGVSVPEGVPEGVALTEKKVTEDKGGSSRLSTERAN
jgi:hypothetical protein